MKSGLSGSNSSGDQTTLAAARRINNFFSPQLSFSLFKKFPNFPSLLPHPKTLLPSPYRWRRGGTVAPHPARTAELRPHCRQKEREPSTRRLTHASPSSSSSSFSSSPSYPFWSTVSYTLHRRTRIRTRTQMRPDPYTREASSEQTCRIKKSSL